VLSGTGITSYAYDPVGNITRIEKNRFGIEVDSGIFEYTYDSLGQLVAAVHGDKIKRYRYDGRGNLSTVVEDGQLKASYTFDATNMMTEAFVAGKGRAEYT